MARLDGRVALVTGASSGIGNAIAAALGSGGADIVVADIRREPKLDGTQSVFDKLDEAGADHHFVKTDVTDETDIRETIDETTEVFGGLDILVNNAGIYYQYPVHETPTEEYDEILDVNLRGTFLCSKAAIPELRDSENGKIINLSSIMGIVGGLKSGAYCASKGGVSNLTRQMSLDYADDEINVNAIAPGIIKTAQNVEWRESSPDVIETWEVKTPWPHFGEPEDVAKAAVFLASDASDFITGHVLSVDGGWTAR